MRLRHALLSALFMLLCAAAARAQTAVPTAASDYAWAPACKECHGAIYDSWMKTKHANAFARLSGSDRKSTECVACHVTGITVALDDDANENVQCEACHGAGKAHIAAAAGGAAKPGAITRRPTESTCTACHSTKSPHFNYFSYAAMAPLVHPK